MGEAICLIIDVGATASARYADGPSFLDAALECASLFVERKLFAETKDEIGIVLFGTEGHRRLSEVRDFLAQNRFFEHCCQMARIIIPG
jgi:hypothetical protein